MAQLLADSSSPRGEAVAAALATLLGALPFARHQTLLLQMAKDGVDGAVLPVQGALGAGEDALADAVPQSGGKRPGFRPGFPPPNRHRWFPPCASRWLLSYHPIRARKGWRGDRKSHQIRWWVPRANDFTA